MRLTSTMPQSGAASFLMRLANREPGIVYSSGTAPGIPPLTPFARGSDLNKYPQKQVKPADEATPRE